MPVRQPARSARSFSRQTQPAVFTVLILISLFALTHTRLAQAEGAQRIPLETYLESADCLVQGTITDIQPASPNAPITITSATMPATPPANLVVIKLRVDRARPALTGPSAEILATIHSSQFAPGKTLILMMTGRNGQLQPRAYPLEDDQGVLPVEGEGTKATVALPLGGQTLKAPADLAWAYLQTLFDQTHGGAATSAAMTKTLKDRLPAAPPAEAALALATLALSPADLPDPAALANIIDARYTGLTANAQLIKRDPDNVPGIQFFTAQAIDAMTPKADEATVDRVLGLLRRDRALGPRAFLASPEVDQAAFRLALQHDGPRRFDRLQNLLRPSGNTIASPAATKAPVPVASANLALLARAPGADIDKLLEKYAPAGDDASQALARQELARLRQESLSPGASLTPASPTPNEYWQPPALASSPATNTQATLAEARDLLARPPKSGSMDELEQDVAARREALLALGRTGSPLAVSLIKPFTQPEFLTLYRHAHQAAYDATVKQADPARPQAAPRSPELQPIDADLLLAALLALTRLKDPAVTAQWRQLAQDPNLSSRVTAAVALFELGDPAALDLLAPFLRHEEQSDRALLSGYLTQGFTPDFQDAVAALRSPRADELFLKRLENGIDHHDAALIQDVPFFQAHAGELLPLLLRQLASRDFSTRYQAAATLEKVLGMPTHWDPLAPSGKQPEKVAQLTQGAEELLKARNSAKLKALH